MPPYIKYKILKMHGSIYVLPVFSGICAVHYSTYAIKSMSVSKSFFNLIICFKEINKEIVIFTHAFTFWHFSFILENRVTILYNFPEKISLLFGIVQVCWHQILLVLFMTLLFERHFHSIKKMYVVLK